MQNKNFYSYKEAADELGLSMSTILKACSSGSLRSQQDPTDKRRKYITRVSLEQYRKKMRTRKRN